MGNKENHEWLSPNEQKVKERAEIAKDFNIFQKPHGKDWEAVTLSLTPDEAETTRKELEEKLEKGELDDFNIVEKVKK